MIRHLLLTGILLAAFAGMGGRAARADELYTFDRDHTAIRFSVSNFGIFDITGVFTEFEGDFMFCREEPKRDRIAITLYTQGIHDTGGELDEELQGPHFFDAVRFPRIDFAGTGVNLIGNNDAEVTGNLTLLGVTRPVILRVHFLESDPDGDDYIVNFSASTVIRRSDFGMDYLAPFPVSDEVRLDIDARGVEVKAP